MSKRPRQCLPLLLFVLSAMMFFFLPISEAISCLNPEVKNQDDSKIKASAFIKLDKFSAKQLSILGSYFQKNISQTEFDTWSVQHNDQAATFLSLTSALSKADLFINSQHITAIDLIDHLSEIRGVRFIAYVNLSLFNSWVHDGAKYTVHLINGTNESGHATFANHDQKGGGLHCGFDTQGYTHYTKTPYIHWNVNETDGTADLHLDGHQPWYWGVVPNPSHLDYTNSDVRYWYSNFAKKYGNPGFEIENYNLGSMKLGMNF